MLNKLKKLDWGILLILAAFCVISTLLVRSATHGNPMYPNYDLKQLVFFGAGFVVAIVATLFDYRIFLKFWYLLYGVGIALLVLVYFFGNEINGARSWFTLPGGLLSFQPAEFMKILLIMTLAVLIARRQGDRLSFTSDLLPVATTGNKTTGARRSRRDGFRPAAVLAAEGVGRHLAEEGMVFACEVA